MQLKNIFSEILAFFQTELGKKILKWGQNLLFIGILIWLGLELYKIGWRKVWESLPVTPYFYLLFLIGYFQLPFFELWIYRLAWVFDVVKSIPTFMIKRVYNKDVLGYSGELYFYAWVKKHLGVPDSEILTTIKDNNIISSAASTFVSVALLGIFVYTGQVKVSEWINHESMHYWLIGGFLLIVVIVFLYRFRNYVIHLTFRKAAEIFGIHLFRLILLQGINLLMFYVVMPDIPFFVWFTYIALEIILSRIPLLPNRDFIFVGMSINLAGALSVDQPSILRWSMS